MFSSRHLEGDEILAANVGTNARAGRREQAAAFSAVLVLAVPIAGDRCDPRIDAVIATAMSEGCVAMHASLTPSTAWL
jgi:hypothetical protein